MKILYVENHQAFIDAVKREFLKDHDIQVVPTVQEAKVGADDSFDLVMCDYDLNDGKGNEFVEYFRTIDSAIPIIAVSSHTKGNDAMLKAGANAVCKKIEFKNINKVISGLVS